MKKALKLDLLILSIILSCACTGCEDEWEVTSSLPEPDKYTPPPPTCTTLSNSAPSLKSNQIKRINLTQADKHTISLNFPECHQIQEIVFGPYVFDTTSIKIKRDDFYPYLTKEQQDSKETYCSVTRQMKYKLKNASGTLFGDYIPLETFTILIPCQKPQDDKKEEDMGGDMRMGD